MVNAGYKIADALLQRKETAIVKYSPFNIRTLTVHYTSTNPQINDYDTF